MIVCDLSRICQISSAPEILRYYIVGWSETNNAMLPSTVSKHFISFMFAYYTHLAAPLNGSTPTSHYYDCAYRS